MTNDAYTVLFDIALEQYQPPQLFIVIGSIGSAIALAWALTSKGRALAGAITVMIFGSTTATAVWSTWDEFERLKQSAIEGHYTVIEGRISNFQPDSAAGNVPQTFSVEGQGFVVRRTDVSFNRTAKVGGPDLSSQCVRIAYTSIERLPNQRKIIWLGTRPPPCSGV